MRNILFAAIAPLLSLSGLAGSVTLGWTPSADPAVAGYHLYYGGVSMTYTNMVAVGNVTNGTVTGLFAGGQYYIAATAVDVAGLESPFSNEVAYEVPGTAGPAPLIVTAANAWRSYGATNPPLTGTVLGLQNGDNITATYSTVATPSSPAGAYVIVPTLIDPNGKLTNYTVTINNGTLTVTPAALTIAAVNGSKVYGAPVPALTASVSGFVNGDTAASLTPPPALATTATATSPAGSYAITASGAASPNYTISYVSGTLRVSPAALTITAASTNKVSGAPLPALTASYSGFVNGDTPASLTAPPALATTATATSPAGSYPITASGAASPNYTITYASGTLTVNPALPAPAGSVALGWTPSSNPAVVGYHVYYGGATMTYTNMVAVGNVTNGTVTGLVTGGKYYFAATALDVAGLESPFSNEVSYQVPGTGGAGGTAPLIVTAANVSRSYGATNPPLTGTVLGLQDGDNITATYASVATASSPVGTYAIVPTLIDPNGKLTNYSVTINDGTLTVTPAALTISAGNGSKVYGAPLPMLTASCSGFVDGDTPASLTTPPVLATTATAASPVGSYPVTVGGAASPNYTISYVSGALSVSPAGLTITAVSTNKLYGAPAPALMASYSGFVNGDTAASLTTPPTLSSIVTPTTAVGTYIIVASGAVDPNYTITYNPGGLTVTKASTAGSLSSSANPSSAGQAVTFTVSIEAVAPGAGKPTGNVQFEIDGAAAGSPVLLSAGVAQYTTSSLASGSHTVGSQYAGDASFLGTTGVLSSPQVVGTRKSSGSTANVVVPAETGPPCSLSITNLGNSFVAIGGLGAPGGIYTLEYTAEPFPTTNWLVLGAVTADPSGAFVLVDTNVLGLRFYRAFGP